MVSVRHLIAAAAAITISTAAFAADLPQPQIAYQPVVAPQPTSAWYLRGQIGIGVTNNSNLVYLQNPLNSSNFAILNSGMGDATFFGGGVGYEFNNWLRFDV